MVKILSVIQNIEQNSQLCQYLTQDNNIDFKITSDEVSVLKQYYDFRPDIFILDTSFKNILKAIYEMSNYTLERKIDRLFLKLHIPLESSPSNRVRKTLIKCCNSPNLLGNLNTLFNTVGKELGTTGEGIRSSFRTALKPLNEFKDKEDLPFAIYKFFPKGEEVTPKLFLDISIYYLKNTKK